MTLLPDFQMDATGWYGGNAYPETREYRVTIQPREGESFYLRIEDSGGAEVGEYIFGRDVADGIIDMANRDHDLTGFEDDWELPVGMVRTLAWDLPTADQDVEVRLTQDRIDQVAAWLRFATKVDVYDGDSDVWEY